MLRWLVLPLSVVSLGLCAATVVVGLRSYHREVVLCYDEEGAAAPKRTKVLFCKGGVAEYLMLHTARGGAVAVTPVDIPLWLPATVFATGAAPLVLMITTRVRRGSGEHAAY